MNFRGDYNDTLSKCDKTGDTNMFVLIGGEYFDLTLFFWCLNLNKKYNK